MKFTIKKCAMQMIKIGKREAMEGTELPNNESSWTLEEK